MDTGQYDTNTSAKGSRDIAGLRSGMVVALHKTEIKRRGVYLWHCVCDCGKEFDTEGRNIRNQKIQSCGCLRNVKRIKDLTGQTFGRLTAVERLEEKEGTSYLWRCRCECGNDVRVSVGKLLSGQVKSCGCLKVDYCRNASKDIRGERFGKLVAVAPTEKRADGGSVVWKCLCDCGNKAEISLNRLQKGKVRSCGCLSNPPLKEYVGKRFGRLTVLQYAGKLNEKTTERYWLCRCDCGKETSVGQTELQNGETVSCGCFQAERLVSSLRLIDNTSVSILENAKKKRVNNKSGYTGVCQIKNGKWIAYINFKKKRYWLGAYDSVEDAARARKRGEEMHDGFLRWYYAEYGSSCEKRESTEK